VARLSFSSSISSPNKPVRRKRETNAETPPKVLPRVLPQRESFPDFCGVYALDGDGTEDAKSGHFWPLSLGFLVVAPTGFEPVFQP
jgi:hypothetical protein